MEDLKFNRNFFKTYSKKFRKNHSKNVANKRCLPADNPTQPAHFPEAGPLAGLQLNSTQFNDMPGMAVPRDVLSI